MYALQIMRLVSMAQVLTVIVMIWSISWEQAFAALPKITYMKKAPKKSALKSYPAYRVPVPTPRPQQEMNPEFIPRTHEKLNSQRAI